MVDSVSGKMASLLGRPGVPSPGGRDPVEPTGSRVDVAGASGPAGTSQAGTALQDAARVGAAGAAARSMAAEPPVDGARVAELRQAIAEGRYRADPDRIAEAMIRSEPGLPGS